MTDKKNIEAIYPLTPMQEALLFHSVQKQANDPGFLQLRCTLAGALHEERFKQAWHHTVHRHAALRTSLHWEDLEKPLQIVHRRVTVPWRIEDWRSMDAAEQNKAWHVLLQEDRQDRLSLTRPPVMRLALCRVAADRWWLVWSCHHALLDGWSGALVLNEVMEAYEALCRAEPLDARPGRPYRDYVRWLHDQELAEAEAFWRQALRGFTAPTPLPLAETDAPAASDHQATELTEATTTALHRCLRQYRVTLNTLLQGVWAILLSRHSGAEEMVFGMTDSGRANDLPGIETMVGLFINTLPVRARFMPDRAVGAFLQQLQAEQVEARPYTYASPAQIHAWSELPPHQRLYESLLVVQNYPSSNTGSSRTLTLSDLQGGITSNYPLTLVAVPGDALGLHLLYDPMRFDEKRMARLLVYVRAILEGIVADPDQPLADLLARAGDRQDSESSSANDSPGPVPRPEIAVPYAAPAEGLEADLAAIWERTLNVDRIGIHDNFFELGGHSLLAVRLLGQIRDTFAMDLPMRTLFEAPTVAELAARIDQAQASAEPQAAPAGIGRVSRDAYRVKHSRLL